MELTQNKFTEFKSEYIVKRKTSTTGKYGQKGFAYAPAGTVHTMWTPVTDEASIAAYGEKVSSMLQAVIYEEDFHSLDDRFATENSELFVTEDFADSLADIDTPVIAEHDQIEIDGMYEVVSVMRYNTHLLVKVQKV